MDRGDVPQNVLAADHETRSSATRTTTDGRHITYQLNVLQQPVRARACGQGAKSSADRRPVDPPPIVELKIFDGETDITFSMQANYFLFATLEQARPIAHGRVSSEKQTPTVLTGTPVAGMVYLDRPSPAGYFIFPDLSVRHEGKYRLSFSLYEDLKNSKDGDKLSDPSEAPSPAHSHVTHRLEVRSSPFIVYSAKKFPGLTESTSLSRMVAEQGCRVRIRRDVRMRRRDAKSNGKDWDDYEEETAQARTTLSGTPDPSAYAGLNTSHGYMDAIPRPRSASNTSHQSRASNISRRQSLQDMTQQYSHQYAATPHTTQNSYSQAAPYGATMTSQYQPQFVPQQSTMQPPPPQYQAQSYTQPQQAAQPAFYGYSAPQVQPSQYGPPQNTYEHPPQPLHLTEYPSQMMQPDHRRSLPQSGNGLSSNATSYAHPGYPSLSKAPYQQPAASRPAPLEPRTNGGAVSMSTRPTFELPPLNTTITPNNRIEAASPASAIVSNSYPSAFKNSADSHKRNYGSVFSDKYQDQPMRQGARPGSVYRTSDGGSAVDDDDSANNHGILHADLGLESLGMKYRRADGREIMRSLPTRA